MSYDSTNIRSLIVSGLSTSGACNRVGLTALRIQKSGAKSNADEITRKKESRLSLTKDAVYNELESWRRWQVK